MITYVLKRLLGAVPTLALIVVLSFLLMRLAPGGPFDEEQALPPEIKANLERAYGLDQPLHVQLGRYVGGLLRGDFGPSFKFKDFTVTELIAAGLPVSLGLGALAMIVAVLAGVPLGVLAAMRHNRPTDHAVMAVAVLGIAVPVFVVAPLAALVFGIHLGWLPVAGWAPGQWRDVVLPTLTLALPIVAYVARLTRGSMLDVLRSPFVRAARARGVPRLRLVWRHALPAALTPVVSYLGPAAAAVLTGSLVVETLFGLPGMGRYLVQAALNRDYTLVMGVVIVYGAFMIVLNLVVDVTYACLDPRVRPGNSR
ncbi:MAG: oppB [Proteobacteria bacterium]|nr:oppB [Pseudomonadota bacterium]